MCESQCNAEVEGLRYFNSGKEGGFNCCESTLYGLKKCLGIENDDIPKIGTPFGGGIGREGHVCGSLIGGLIILGFKYGRESIKEERKPSYEAARRLLEKFKDEYGTIDCAEITELDLQDEQQVEEEKEYVHENICRPLVQNVCKWVQEDFESN